jgi:hypothetical protein
MTKLLNIAFMWQDFYHVINTRQSCSHAVMQSCSHAVVQSCSRVDVRFCFRGFASRHPLYRGFHPRLLRSRPFGASLQSHLSLLISHLLSLTSHLSPLISHLSSLISTSHKMDFPASPSSPVPSLMMMMMMT